jgi:adenylyltransferase/sulfurtransferase
MKTLPLSGQSKDRLNPDFRTATRHLSRTALAAMRFVVVGAGALGNEVVKNLGLLGAGSVTVIDPDHVELSNLSRSVFFRANDCGRPKAETICLALTSVFPDTRWEFRNCEISDVGFGELAGADLILTCVDSDLARVEAAWISLRLDIPMADAGLGGPDYGRGRVSFFAGRSSACFCCKLSPRRRRDLLALALSTGHSCWAQAETTQVSSTPTMAAITGALQLDFGLRCLTEFRSGGTQDVKSSTVEITLDSNARLRRFVTSISSGCPFHIASKQESVPLPHSQASARELLDDHGAHAVDLDWPICLAARCLDCGSDWQPMKRVAWLRRRGICPHCGSHRILENQSVASLDRNSAWAESPLMDLGLPEHHLYAVRSAIAREDAE